MSNIAFILCCLYFCFKSFRDFQGWEQAIKPQYRDLPGRKEWQNRKAILEATIGIGSLLFLPFQKYKTVTIVIASVVFVAFILMIINDKKYTMQNKE